jgi:hypothetical protein
VSIHHEVVVEVELSLRHPDLGRGTVEQIDDERGGIIEPSTVREIGAGERLSLARHATSPTSPRG